MAPEPDARAPPSADQARLRSTNVVTRQPEVARGRLDKTWRFVTLNKLSRARDLYRLARIRAKLAARQLAKPQPPSVAQPLGFRRNASALRFVSPELIIERSADWPSWLGISILITLQTRAEVCSWPAKIKSARAPFRLSRVTDRLATKVLKKLSDAGLENNMSRWRSSLAQQLFFVSSWPISADRAPLLLIA